LPVRLFGEDLVLFRDEQGCPGLLDIHCPHWGADEAPLNMEIFQKRYTAEIGPGYRP